MKKNWHLIEVERVDEEKLAIEVDTVGEEKMALEVDSTETGSTLALEVDSSESARVGKATSPITDSAVDSASTFTCACSLSYQS